MKVIVAGLSAFLMLPVCATAKLASAADAAKTSTNAQVESVNDVIAKVGDQTITFSEINVALNSSAIVGISIPAVGTPERDTARIVLLDRFVSANLLYLDALKQGVDKDPDYRKAISRFSNAMLAGFYRKHEMAGEVPVSEEEIQAYYHANVEKDTELTDEVRLQIESRLRREKLHERLAAAQKSLRDGVQVVVREENLAVADDGKRAPEAVLAEVGGERITWGQVDDRIKAAGTGALMENPTASEDQARRDALEREIDLRIMVQKAKAAGLDQDPVFQRRVKEYGKTLLVNTYRERLTKGREPAEKELKAYYEANKSRFIVPEARKLQMVVVKTEAEAADLKEKLQSGKLTMYQAARDHSIAAKAKQDLGEVGWVNQGELAPPLDKVVFGLGPGEIGGPVETPAGWHLVKVLDMKEAQFTDYSEEATRQLARRRYLHEKMDEYTAELRKSEFPVEVYQERLVQLEQQEADAVKALAAKSQEPGSVTEQRIKELNRLVRPDRPGSELNGTNASQ